MTKLLTRLWKDEEGATAVEYGIMVALIALIIIGGVTLLGQNLSTTFHDAGTAVPAG
jgi:pilus assembly protein Flp/PilA